MDIGTVSSLGLLQRKLLGTFLYKSLYERMFSFLSGPFLEVEELGHMVGVDLTFKETAERFQSSCTNLHATSRMGELQVLHNHDESLWNKVKMAVIMLLDVITAILEELLFIMVI